MNDYTVEKICIDKLHSFYINWIKEINIPISLKRIESYLNNPNGYLEKSVLFLEYIDSKLVAYRSVFQDSFSPISKVECVWLSGVWTHPNFRRRGFAQSLLEEIYKEYNGMVFVSNLATKSAKLIQKSKYFSHLHSLNGHRFYYRLPLHEILPPKHNSFSKLKPILKIIDTIINSILDLRFILAKRKSIFIQSSEFNQELNKFISKHNQNSLFKRNTDEFKWILEYPWIEEKNEDDENNKKYHFTTSAKIFYQKALTIQSGDKINGFIFYTVKNKEMKIHYIFYDSEKEVEKFSNFILNEIRQKKINYLTMADEKLIEITKKKGGFLFSKIWKKDFFVGKKLLEHYPEITNKDIYLGDGDSIFT